MKLAIQRLLGFMMLLLVIGIGPLHAQTAVTGALVGYVSDASTAAVSGAAVEATNTSTNVQEQAKTNRDGEYRFSSLIPGTYS
ncbi:MAG: carboxypeptidase-like regulatory domain-containing protein, partial [Acidobacteriaceae bacterium]